MLAADGTRERGEGTYGGTSRTLMVMNTAFGKPELLPFDLKQRRVMTYQLPKEAEKKAPVRKELAQKLEEAIRAILAEIKVAHDQNQPVAKGPSQQAVDTIDAQRPDRQRHIRKFMEWLTAESKKLDPSLIADGHEDDNLVNAIASTAPLVDEFGRVAEAVSAMSDGEGARALFKELESVLAHCYLPKGFSGHFRTTAFDLFKFLTHELAVILVAHLMREGRWQILSTVLDERLYRANTGQGQDVQSNFVCLSARSITGHVTEEMRAHYSTVRLDEKRAVMEKVAQKLRDARSSDSAVQAVELVVTDKMGRKSPVDGDGKAA